MDFNTFLIAGPNTVASTIGNIVYGVPTSGAAVGVPVTQETQCLTDTFTITGPSGATPPVVCGTNTGHHGKLVCLQNKLFIILNKVSYVYTLLISLLLN